MYRRQFVYTTVGASTVTALAGCMGDTESSSNPEQDGTSGNGETSVEADGDSSGGEAPQDPSEVPALSPFELSDSNRLTISDTISYAPNWDGVVYDYRGYDSVTIRVGELYDGEMVFSPVVALIDGGTTVKWEWTGNGEHNVIARDTTGPDFSMWDLISEAGVHHEYTFDDELDDKLLPVSSDNHVQMAGGIIVNPVVEEIES